MIDRSDLNIRQMTFEDIPRVAEIEREAFSIPWSENAYKETLESGNAFYLVAETDTILGMCGLILSFDEADVTNVAVRESCRGQGIAKAMMEKLLEAGAERGVKAFSLEVRVSNEPAIALYRSFGFEVEGIRKRFYERPVEDAMIMWRREHGTDSEADGF